MQVISGSAKGKKLKSPKGNIRPLSSQAKEALFNILQNRVAGAYFLDLFAGSGAVGIEALSRGATLSIFIELDKKTVRVMRENVEFCGFAGRAEIYALEAVRALKILKKKEAKFDIIFIGAPYGSPNLAKALLELSDGGLLKERGFVVAEHRKQHQLEESYEKLLKFREAKYGETVFTFYENSSLSR